MNNKTDYKKIGMLIKKYRNEKKLTQTDLANLIGKAESSIRKYEKGLVQIPDHVIIQICISLNISLNLIYGENVEKEIIDLYALYNNQMTTEDYIDEHIIKPNYVGITESNYLYAFNNYITKDFDHIFPILFDISSSLQLSSDEIEDLYNKVTDFTEYHLKKLLDSKIGKK